MTNNKHWEPLIKPILVLTAICIAVSGLLALTNSLTAPVIAENTRRVADESRIEILPDADAFDKLELKGEPGIITEIHKAKNGAGYVLSGAGKGYAGNLPVMISILPDGKINKIKVMENSETPGVGKKVETEAFTEQFKGAKDTKSVATISGATISSVAVLQVVDAAVEAYNNIIGG